MSLRLDLIRVILKKELTDLLRDRRTIFMMVVLPIILYPILLLLVMQLAILQAGRLTEQVATVVIINGEAAPELRDEYLLNPLIDIADSIGWRDALQQGELDAAIEFSPGFNDAIESTGAPEVKLYYNSSRDFSRIARNRLESPLDSLRDAIVEARLIALNTDPSILEPFALTDENLASDEQQQGTAVGKMLGYLLIFMVLTGAFYSAIDLTAGEKERGTLETLLVSPVGRLEIVYGKFLAAVTATVVTALLNLVSLGLTAIYGIQLVGNAIEGGAGITSIAINPVSLLLVFLVVIPLAVVFAGVCLAIAITARNYKEGQSALTPVMMLSIIPAMIVFLPGVELSPALALIPISNVVLLTVEFMGGNYLLLESLITIFSNSVFALMALWWVNSQFHQESVVFRHADDIKWNLFAKRTTPSTPLPSPGVALLTAMVLMILLNLAASLAAGGSPMRSIFISQAVIIIPVILILQRGGHNVKKTLALRAPRIAAWPSTIIATIGGWFITLELTAIQHSFLPFPTELLDQFTDLFAALNALPLLSGLLIIAALPGVCEELLCRGFMLRAFRPRLGATGAIVIVAIIFGLLHMNPYRLLPTILLGLLLGVFTVWSGSIYPAMLGHVINNAASYLVQKHQAWFEGISWLSSEETEFLPAWIVVVGVCLLGAGLYGLRKAGSTEELDRDGIPRT